MDLHYSCLQLQSTQGGTGNNLLVCQLFPHLLLVTAQPVSSTAVQPPHSCPAEAEGKSQQNTLQNVLSPLIGQCTIPTRDEPQNLLHETENHPLPHCDAAVLYHIVKGPVRSTESTIRESGSSLSLSRSPSLNSMWLKAVSSALTFPFLP